MATSQLPCPAPRTSPGATLPILPGAHHKSQQSHDSGTYLDWSPEEAPGPAGDFVTVVSVDGAPVPLERTTPFVTVLSIGPAAAAAAAAAFSPGAPAAAACAPSVVHVEGPGRPRPLPEGAEEVSVYRLPGERLGFGLKFEGGAGAVGVPPGPGDAVRRLLIQSCAPESPASRVLCSWGPLGEGDEILEIDQVAVNTLTKAECVHAMKESKVVMRLLVRGAGGASGRGRPVVCGELKKGVAAAGVSPPPPIPPRKSRPSVGSAPSSPLVIDGAAFPDLDAAGAVAFLNGVADGELAVEHEKQPLSRTSSASSAASSASRLASKRTSPITPRAGKRNGLFQGPPLPPDAEVYLDLLSLERYQGLDSESDDTNSSLSTVVAMPSTSNSSISASSPTTPGPGASAIDLARLLGPFERLERELAESEQGAGGQVPSVPAPVSSPASAAASTTQGPVQQEPAFVFPELQPPPCFQDAPLSYGDEEVRPARPNLLELDKQLEDEADGDAEEAAARSRKKRAPPPPPPRGRPQPQQQQQPPQPAPRGDRLPRLVHCVPKEGPAAPATTSEEVVPAAPTGPSTAASDSAIPEPLERLIERQHLLDLITPSAKAASPAATATPTAEGEGEDSPLPEETVQICEVTDDDLDGEVTLRLPDLVMDSQQQDGGLIDEDADGLDDGEDFASYRRSLSSPLPTIGEDEEDTEHQIGVSKTSEPAASETAPAPTPRSAATVHTSDAPPRDVHDDVVDGVVHPTASQTPQEDVDVDEDKDEDEVDEEKVMAAFAQELLDNLEEHLDDQDEQSLVCEDGDCNNNNQQQQEEHQQHLQQQQQQQQLDQQQTKGGAAAGSRLGVPGQGRQGPHNPMPVRSAGLPPLGLPLGPPLGHSVRAVPAPRSTEHHGGVPGVPPSASRQPPDGDEFPPRYHDPLLLGAHPALEPAVKGASTVPPLPLTSPPGSTPGTPAAAPAWRKDERSERSVRDKIAMFTSAASPASSPAGGAHHTAAATPHAPVTRRLSNKFKSTEDVFAMLGSDVVDGAADAKLRSRSVVSVDRVGKACSPESTSSSAYSSFCSPESSLSPTLNESSTLPRKSTAPLTRATSFTGSLRPPAPTPSGPVASTATPVAAASDTPNAVHASSGAVEEARRASLIALVEQRRRSISKLRGLVIPDKVPDAATSIVDLPEIRSKEAILIASSAPPLPALPQSLPQPPFHDTRQPSATQQTYCSPSTALSSPPWKSQGASNLPKYSPAFKRKSLTVRAAPPTKPSLGLGQDLLIGDATKSDKSFLSDSGRSAEEESDNDSAVSSSRSSISHGFSPPASPLLSSATAGTGLLGRSSNSSNFLRRTLSSDAATSPSTSQTSSCSSSSSSSSSSCSSSNGNSWKNNNALDNNRRVLKAQSVDAINRKNVLFSARCRSGRNLRAASPLMQREDEAGEDDDEVSAEDSLNTQPALVRRDPREEIKELERMVNMADTDVESNDALSCDDSVNSSDDTLEPSHGRPARVHYRPAGLRDLRDLAGADVKVAFLNDTQSAGVELDLHPVGPASPVSPVSPASPASPAGLQVDGRALRPARPSLSDTVKGMGSPKDSNGLLAKLHDDGRKPVQPPVVLPKPLSRKGSLDGVLNGDAVDGSVLATESVPRLRSLKKRNASDPLFLERNGGGVSHASHPPHSSSVSTLHAVSVNDIRKAFEKAELALSPTSPSPPGGRLGFGLNGLADSASSGSSAALMHSPSHARGSSIDSTTSEDGFPGHLSKEQYGSITSLASTTSLISQQELQQLIDDANQTLEEANSNGSSPAGSSHEVLVVILHRETAGASVGITLAGGADYETKEITVHKVLSGSPAERDGRLQKGDRILSINGRNMKGVTHRESLAILKAPRPEVVLVVSRSRGDISRPYEESLSNGSRVSSRPPRILEQPLIDHKDTAIPRGPPVNVVLQKDGAGLGFSLEGGKDSPLGDRPLTIKKIFTGGCAEKSGSLQAGDELLNVNNTDVTKMSRIEAWGLMKRLPNGSVTLTIRHACVNAGAGTAGN